MRFLLLVHGDPTAEAALDPDERMAIVEAHLALGRELHERGALVMGEALEPPEATRTVRFEDGRPTASSGPSGGPDDAIGGFYVLDCASLDEAVEIAGRLPRSPGLAVEVLTIAAT